MSKEQKLNERTFLKAKAVKWHSGAEVFASSSSEVQNKMPDTRVTAVQRRTFSNGRCQTTVLRFHSAEYVQHQLALQQQQLTSPKN